MKWATLQRAPIDYDALTEDEHRWVLMQHRIDEGIKWCGKCDRFGWHTFCGQCGRRYFGADLTWRECPRCKTLVTTDYCSLCGAPVYDERLRRYIEGDPEFIAEANARVKRMMQEQFKLRPAPEQAGASSRIVAALQETFGARRS